MDFGTFFTGIFFTGLGGVILFAYTVGVINGHEMANWMLYIGIPLVLFGLLNIWWGISPTKYYCSDCGQYLGFSSMSCPRCGCNIYTTRYKGVGRTTRRGPYNL